MSTNGEHKLTEQEGIDQNGSELAGSRNTSSSMTNSNNISGSSEDPSSDGDNSELGDKSELNFTKRRISENQGRNSYSQLSSMTAKSPDRPLASTSKRRKHKHKKGKETDGSNDKADKDGDQKNDGDEKEDEEDDDEHVGEADHQERIRNPASSAFRRNDQRERIGFRQPFGDTEVDVASSQGSNAQGPGSSAQTSPTDLTSTFGLQSNRRKKHYEPARAVLHRSDLGADDSNGENAHSETPSRSSSIVPLSRAGSRAGSPEIRPRGSIPLSIVTSLSGSPDDYGTVPLKHLREPKQPIYIPAVLRPTDFNSYHSHVGTNHYSSDAPRKPITQHWVRDSNAEKCRACDKRFTLFRRRHHCRKCGGVFCSYDTKHTIGLDRVLNFNILGMPCRACDTCAAEFTGFCLDAPRLREGPVSTQQPIAGPEQEEAEVLDGGDWSTF